MTSGGRATSRTRISAIVVNYDSGPDLERCLDSLRAPAGRELEVVVVDNASTDGSAEQARRRFPRVHLLALAENLGFGAAVNRGVAEAGGELLLLSNPDARPAPGCLDALAARLEAEPDLGLVAPRLLYPDGRPQTVWAPDPGLAGEAIQRLRNRLEGRAWIHRGFPRLLRRLFGPGWITAACALVRREAFERVGGFDPGYFLYFEDADLCLRLRRAGWRLAVEPRARAVHAATGGRRGGRVEVEYRRSQLRYYALHRPRWEGATLRRYLLAKYRWFRPPDETARAVVELLEAWEPWGTPAASNRR